MVDTYIIGSYCDQSFGTVFQKDSPSTTYSYTPDQEQPSIEIVSKKDIRAYNRLDAIDTLSKFEENFDSLFKVIKSKMMGKGPNKDLENQLLEIKAKITERGESNPDFERKINALIKMSTGAIKTIFNNKDITAMLK